MNWSVLRAVPGDLLIVRSTRAQSNSFELYDGRGVGRTVKRVVRLRLPWNPPEKQAEVLLLVVAVRDSWFFVATALGPHVVLGWFRPHTVQMVEFDVISPVS